MAAVLTSLVILGCSKRKRRTSRLLPAIDRYDGPIFQVLRKRIREAPETSPDTFVLSGRFGLIPGTFPIPRYDRRLAYDDHATLRLHVEAQLKQTLDQLQPESLFVSVGCRYWLLLEEPLMRQVAQSKLVVATGGIGGRASQLAHWLGLGEDEARDTVARPARGEAVLLGTTVRLRRAEVLQKA